MKNIDEMGMASMVADGTLASLPAEVLQGVFGIGVDIQGVTRIQTAVERTGAPFIEKVYTEREVEYANAAYFPAERFAACWAAKEAAVKALGTGLTDGISYKDVQLCSVEGQAPFLELSGRFAELANERSINNSFVSISHDRDYVIAVVVLGQGARVEVSEKEPALAT